METFVRDVRASVRTLMKKPGFTVVVVLMLAFGIAANTAIFSVVNGVLLRALPYPQEDRIVTVWQSAPKRGVEREETSPADFFDWSEQSQSFGELGMAGPVVVLGYNWWQQHFGGDPNLVGQKLTLNNQATTVVGIMPREFEYPPGREVWAPRPRRENDPQNRGRTFIWVVGRLKPGRTAEQAQKEMSAIGARLAEQYPQTNAGIGVTLVPLRQILFGEVRPALLVLFGAVGLVLLIACANVANLFLARAAERQREFAIRGTLGASRSRIVRQLMTESLVLAALGGAAGVLLSGWLIRLIVALSANNLPRLGQINLNSSVLLFAVSISLLTALLFGLAPALQNARINLQDVLKESTHTTTAGNTRQHFRRALVVTQVAVAFVLLVGAGLLARSFAALLEVDPGFAANKALTLEVQLARRTPEQRAAFLDQTLEKLAAMPGVAGAGAASALPFHDNQVAQPTTIKIEGRPSVAPEGDATANCGSFTTEIVGVVGDTRTAGLEIEPAPEIFVSHASAIGYPNSMTYFVRTTTDPLRLLPAVKEKIREANKDQAFSGTATIDQLVERSLSRRRFNLLLLASFAVLALILAGVGLYGLISFMTSQRTHEIGIRMAFGADSRDVLKLIIGEGMTLTLAGVAIGLLASLALTRLMESLLFGISATDPVTFVVIAFVLGGVPFLACYIPARRATKVDPMVSLRHE